MSDNSGQPVQPQPDQPQPVQPQPDQPQPVQPQQPPAGPAYGYGQPPGPPAGGYPPPAYAPPPGTLSPSDERTWAGAGHWSAYLAALVGLSFLGPLVVMVTQGTKSPFVRRHAVEALNFQISMLIYGIVSAILVLVLVGIIGLIAVGLMWLILPIMGTIKAANGEEYRYPLTIRLVR